MKVVALTFLLAAQASAHGALRQLQTTEQICEACQTCEDVGPFICNGGTLEIACDNCESYPEFNICERCTSCGQEDCDLVEIAKQTCQDECDLALDIPATFVCFSEVATVQVLNKGTVAMKDLKVGDQVMTEQGVYDSVYAFGHHHPTKLATFFQIYSQNNEQPLEVTPDHLVFLNDKSAPVPAQDIQVGDVLRGSQGVENKVKKIATVQRQGVYAPITMNGSLLVDGVSTSSYVRVPEKEESFITMADHDLIHIALSPYRLLCNGVSSMFCDTQFHHKESGMPYYAYFGELLCHWFSQSHSIVKTFVFSVVLLLTGTFQVVENVFGASLAPLALFILGAVYVSNKNSKQGKAKVV